MENFQNKTLLVTGGAGFIGSEFVRTYSSKFKKTFVIDSMTYASDINRIQIELDSSNVELIQEDILNIQEYKTLIREVDFIVHFAAESHVDNSITASDIFLDTNVMGTFKLLELFRKTNVEARFLYVSTDEVYGSAELPRNEFDILNPSSQYSATKAAAELICLANYKTHKQNIVITRGCNNYGPFQHGEKFIPNVLTKLLHGRTAQVYGDGNNVREWIHISDHCEGIFKVLTLGDSGEIYNIGSGERVSNNVLVKKILELLSLPEDLIEYIPDRKGHDLSYSLDSSKINKNLKWIPSISFNEGLEEVVKWYRDNPAYAQGILN